MDIKAKIDELAARLKGDKDLLSKFQKNPAATVSSLLGISLPESEVNKLVDGIQAKLKLDDLSTKLGSLFGKK